MNLTSTFDILFTKSYFEICKNDYMLLLSIYHNNSVYNYDIFKTIIEVYKNFNKLNREISFIFRKQDNLSQNYIDYKNIIYPNDLLFINQTKNRLISIVLAYIIHQKNMECTYGNVKIKYRINKANKLLNEIRKN